MFKKILIANRGEIALRVIRTCREMGIATVAVYSKADRKALHVRMADEAVCVGESAPKESYLSIDAMIRATRATGAQAIHPGYGFLSENAEFSERCEREGIVFIGPSASAMRLMGDKIGARRTMAELGGPTVPGTLGAVKDMASLRKEAERIGFPVMLKAASGGGGKGIRVVREAGELESAFKMATGEAGSAFGSTEVFLEKYVENPRHIEIQIMADRHGNAVYLGERECSLQRRHQKLVEETPSPFVTPELRKRMGELAVKAVLRAGYVGAGTLEFLVDAKREFYFLEMNTRLQVEHTVTEMATGIDLVREQIRVAAGEKLSFTQTDVQPRGSAVECRVCAEDVDNHFMPSVGIVCDYQAPGGQNVRVESAIYDGMEVSLFYDPMLAKVVVWGPDRASALCKMQTALREFQMSGVKTTVPLFCELLADPDVVAGNIHTGFLDRWMMEKYRKNPPAHEVAALVSAALHRVLTPKKNAGTKPANGGEEESPWMLSGRPQARRPMK